MRPARAGLDPQPRPRDALRPYESLLLTERLPNRRPARAHFPRTGRPVPVIRRDLGARIVHADERSLRHAERSRRDAERRGRLTRPRPGACGAARVAESSALMSWEAALILQVVLTALAALFVYLMLRRQRRGFGTLEERATLRTLAFATSTMRSLRGGLDAASANRVLAEVAEQAGAEAVALYDQHGLLGFHPVSAGPAESHRLHAGVEAPAVLDALASGRLKLVHLHPRRRRPPSAGVAAPAVGEPDACELRSGVVAPLVVGDRAVAALVTYHIQTPGPAALRIAAD